MGEAVVLADLWVDSKGVISGINESDRALAKGGASLNRFGATSRGLSTALDTTVTRMFSLQKAALGLGGALGIAGVVLSLANAVKTLVSDVISSTEWFRRSKEAVTDWYREIIKGEDAVDRLSRKLGDTSTFSLVTSLRSLQDDRRRIIEELQDVPSGGILARGLLLDLKSIDTKIDETVMKLRLLGATSREIGASAGTVPRGVAPSGGAFQVSPFAAAGGAALLPSRTDIGLLEDIHDKFMLVGKILNSANAATIQAAEAIRHSGLSAAAREAARVAKELAAVDREMRQMITTGREAMFFGPEYLEQSAREADRYFSALESGAVFLDQFDRNMERTRLNTQLLSDIMGFTTTKIQEFSAAIPQSVESIVTFSDSLKEMLEDITLTNLQLDVFSAASAAFAHGVSDAAIRGGGSIKKILGDTLAAMVPVFLAYGAMGLVKGLLFDDPKGFAAAKVAFPAAAAAALAARALGAGQSYGQERSDRGGSGGVGAATSQPQPDRNVTITIHGSIIGTNPDDLARELLRLQRTAEEDGA